MPPWSNDNNNCTDTGVEARAHSHILCYYMVALVSPAIAVICVVQPSQVETDVEEDDVNNRLVLIIINAQQTIVSVASTQRIYIKHKLEPHCDVINPW